VHDTHLIEGRILLENKDEDDKIDSRKLSATVQQHTDMTSMRLAHSRITCK